MMEAERHFSTSSSTAYPVDDFPLYGEDIIDWSMDHLGEDDMMVGGKIDIQDLLESSDFLDTIDSDTTGERYEVSCGAPAIVDSTVGQTSFEGQDAANSVNLRIFDMGNAVDDIVACTDSENPNKKRKGLGRGPSRRAGKKKPKGFPKRPLSAYNLFFQSERPKIFQEGADDHPRVTFEELGKIVGRRWQVLSEEKRNEFHKLSDKDIVRYRQEMDSYEEFKPDSTITTGHEKEKAPASPKLPSKAVRVVPASPTSPPSSSKCGHSHVVRRVSDSLVMDLANPMPHPPARNVSKAESVTQSSPPSRKVSEADQMPSLPPLAKDPPPKNTIQVTPSRGPSECVDDRWGPTKVPESPGLPSSMPTYTPPPLPYEPWRTRGYHRDMRPPDIPPPHYPFASDPRGYGPPIGQTLPPMDRYYQPTPRFSPPQPPPRYSLALEPPPPPMAGYPLLQHRYPSDFAAMPPSPYSDGPRLPSSQIVKLPDQQTGVERSYKLEYKCYRMTRSEADAYMARCCAGYPDGGYYMSLEQMIHAPPPPGTAVAMPPDCRTTSVNKRTQSK